MTTPVMSATALVASLSLLSACTSPAEVAGDGRRVADAGSAADADKSSRTPLGMVVTWAKTVKAQARRPDTVQWNNLLANKDGSVVCLEYRAQDDSGTANVNRVAFITGNGARSTSSWEQHCTQQLYNMAYAVPFIDGN